MAEERIKAKIEELVEAGSVLQWAEGPFPSQVVARAKLLGGGRMRWVPIHPNHQGDIHTLEYDEAKVVYDRDVLFYRDGQIVAGLTPIEESDMNVVQATTAYEEWKELLKVGHNADYFDHFFEYA